VKLKRLIIQGFKSFKDRTTIQFDDGITGIVGPNGCGKSNIVDALFWIMGEQSAKHLRGSTMKDVIFSGSSKYQPSNWAEATLVLENTEGKHIHIGNTVASPEEIQLTRKLYRNGETEYRINDNPCRLKDIQEVFMDTGAGAKSYSIIAQGEINRIVQQKPEDRRMMIEEVAGITKFKLRRRESLKKIEHTQANLARLNDLKTEIEKNLKSLEKQAEKAERARHLKERVTKYELITEGHKVFDLLKDIRDHRNFLNDKTVNLENWKLKKDNLEVSLEEERIEKETQTEKLDELQSEFNQLSRQLAAHEERLLSLAKSEKDKHRQLEDKIKEKQEIQVDLEKRSAKKVELEKSRDQLLEKSQQEIDFSSVEEKVNLLKEEITSKEDELSIFNKDYEQLKREWEQLRQEKFLVGPKLQEYAAAIEDMSLEIEALEKQYSGITTELQAKRDELKKLEASSKNAEEEEKKNTLALQETRVKFKAVEESLRLQTKNTLQVESRLNSLIELNNSLEGLKKGNSDLLAEAKEKGDWSIQVFGSLLKCAPEYTSAVQRALQELMGSLSFEQTDLWQSLEERNGLESVNDGFDAVLAVERGSEKILSSQETAERLRMKGFEQVQALKEVVSIDERFAHLRPLLEGHYLAVGGDLETWKKISPEINFRTLTGIDGQFHITNLSNGMRLSTFKEGEDLGGQVARNNKIEELQATFNEALTVKEKLEKEFEETKLFLTNVENEVDSKRLISRETREKFISLKTYLDSKTEAFNSGNSRLQILINRRQETSKMRLELMVREEEILKREEKSRASLDQRESIIADLRESLDLIKSTYEDERGEFLKLSAEAKTFQDRLQSFESQIRDIEEQLNRLEQRSQNTAEAIQRLEDELVNIEDEGKALQESNQNQAQVLQDKEEVLNLLKDRLAELLIGMQEREAEVKELGQKINKTEKEMIEHEVKITQSINEEVEITRNIFEKYRIDLRRGIGPVLTYTEEEYQTLQDCSSMFVMEGPNGPETIAPADFEFTRRYGQDLKDCAVKLRDSRSELNRMGEINWQAIEDYDRQKLRFDFLSTQEEELKASLLDLQMAIDKIDNKSKERFKVAFEEVNMRFERVFPIIFGGGTAKLALTSSPDDPECGIDIIAQPPGKKMVNINLMSGGEKALTAVSLIFSIFLVKPSPFCLLDEVDAPLDDANVGRFNELLREMSKESQFILITHNKKTMELNDMLYGVTMQEPGVSKAVSVQLH